MLILTSDYYFLSFLLLEYIRINNSVVNKLKYINYLVSYYNLLDRVLFPKLVYKIYSIYIIIIIISSENNKQSELASIVFPGFFHRYFIRYRDLEDLLY